MEININGLKISYEVFGDGEETAILLQGWGTNYSLYEPIAKLLSEKMRVILFDFPGFGDSDEPKEAWGVSDFSDFFLDFVKALNITHATLLGHSFGGRVIIKLSANHCRYYHQNKHTENASNENDSDELKKNEVSVENINTGSDSQKGDDFNFKIDRIVLIDSAGIKAKLSDEQKKKIKRYKRLKKLFSNKFVHALAPKMIDEWKSRQGSEDYRNASPMMRQCMVKAINEDLTEYLPKVREEVLLVWGENDTATPLADGKLMEKDMPNAGLAVIHNAGHFSFLEQPVVFENIMRSYFKF